MADNTAAIALGYGREKSGRIGGNSAQSKVGFNAYALRTVGGEHFVSGAKIVRTGETYPLSITQEHGSMEGRPIIREANLEDFRNHPAFARNFDLDSPHHTAHIKKEVRTDGQVLAERLYKNTYAEYDDKAKKLGKKPAGADAAQRCSSVGDVG